MSSDSIQILTSEVQSFCDAREWDQFHTPKDLAIGICTEAAELLAHFRFLSSDEAKERIDNPGDRQEIANEVGDTLFFLLRFCQRVDIDPAAALRGKLAINEAKYPVARARGRNVKYDRL